MTRRMLGIALALSAGLALPMVALADTRPSPASFSSLVERSSLIMLVTVTDLTPERTLLRVDRFLKGSTVASMAFPTRPTDVPLTAGERAVIAFEQPDLDSRAGTIAWEVAPDGRIDPHGFQRYPGLPSDLDAFLALFGAGPVGASSEPTASPSSSPGSAGEGSAGGPPESPSNQDAAPRSGGPVLVGVGLAGAVILFVLWRRWSSSRRRRC